MSETYLEAYGRRMKKVDELLLEMTKTFHHHGYDVYTSGQGFHFILIISKTDNKHIYLGFTDVPYRWYLSCTIEFTPQTGNGRTIKEGGNFDTIEGMTIPWNEEEIIESMLPNPKNLIYKHLMKYE